MTQPPPPPPPAQPQYGAPQPMNPQDEKTWAILIHLSGILFSFVGALIGYLVLRDRGPFIRHHTAQALNFQLSLLIYYVALYIVITIIGLVTLGIGFLLYALVGLVAIAALIFMIIAAVQANQGQYYRYPLTIQFLK